MFLFRPRSLALLLLGAGLPVLFWQATRVSDAWAARRQARRDERRCGYFLWRLDGALKRYEADHGLEPLEPLEPPDALYERLVEEGYLQRFPADWVHHPGPGDHYAWLPRAARGVVCLIHGDGRWYPARRSGALGRYLQEVGAPFGAGVLAVLLFQALLSRRSRSRRAREAAYLECIARPAFRPATKPTLAGLAPEATCPVCSELLGAKDQSLIECLRCETPHHLDCAGYTEACGVYGCGEDDPAP